MRILLTTLVLSFSFVVCAQHSEQPQKESSVDLRHQGREFSVELSDQSTIYSLEKTPNQDYLLRLKKGSTEAIQKIDANSAKKMDKDFAHRFLKCQYELPTTPGDCKVSYRLTMRGEAQDICSKDDKKSQEISRFVEVLSKRF